MIHKILCRQQETNRRGGSVPLRFLSFAIIALCNTAIVFAQIADIQPRTVQPGVKSKHVVSGQQLGPTTEFVSTSTGIPLKLEVTSPEQAVLEIDVAPDAPLGAFGIWGTTASSLQEPFVFVCDDITAIPRVAANTAREAAQPIANLSGIFGTSRGAESDFYKLTVEAGKTLSFEVLSQSLLSNMDPIVRLYKPSGELLMHSDDDGAGVEPRFQYRFESAGDYLLEVRDARYVAGGAYYLRVGDFPIANSAKPCGVIRGQSSKIAFLDPNGNSIGEKEVQFANGFPNEIEWVSYKPAGAQSSSWSPIRVVNPETKIFEESAVVNALPASMYGTLTEAGKPDTFKFLGQQGQAVRIQAKTKSLRFPTLLRMKLKNAAGAVVAETATQKEDEWGFDFTFPSTEEFTLEVTDLLKRNGIAFSYWIDCIPLTSFQLAIKGDANTKQQFIVDEASGAFAIDLLCQRSGYKGEVDLEFANPNSGYILLNPTIPAEAAEHRVFVLPQPAAPQQAAPRPRFASLQIIGRSRGEPRIAAGVSSLSISRLKRPHVPYPPQWSENRFSAITAPAINVPFDLQPSPSIRLAQYVDEQDVALDIKRLADDFKAPFTVLPTQESASWPVITKLENDKVTITLKQLASKNQSATTVPLSLYSEHGGRGLAKSFSIPVSWFSPVQFAWTTPKLITPSRPTELVISVVREQTSAPISIKWLNVPTGVVLPELVSIAADQNSVAVPIQVTTEYKLTKLNLQYTATSNYAGKDFSFTSSLPEMSVERIPTELEVYPIEIALDGKQSKRHLVVTGKLDNGSVTDWTKRANVKSLNEAVAKWENGVVVPVSDGETVIQVQAGTIERTIPVRVTNPSVERRTDFESEVLVALSKQGCNSGACHGSPSGKGMFRLSLRAFDKQLDELTLIHEEFGRRLNLVKPEQSLLLLKPLMSVYHGGGKQIRQDDAAYKVLLKWLQEGGKPDPANTPRCARLEVYPGEKRMLPLTGGSQQIAAIAHFANGSQRDVTELVAYESSNQQIAEVNAYGLVTPKSKGEVVILVRFLEHIESVRLTFIDHDPNYQWTAPSPANFVDTLINDKLQQMQLLPAARSSDSEFVRRVYLDVLGVLPTVAETKQFLENQEPNKRSALIDQLLEREEYAKFWANKWGDLLKLTNKLVGAEGVYKYHQWIEDSIRADVPYDRFARELITASGSTLANPPANFYRTATDMNECVETISQVFLGARLQCAKCHNHPFERWTQDNYYGLGAFFNRIQRKETLRPGEMFVWSNEQGEVVQPRTGQTMKPWLPGVGSQEASADDRRQMFADWLTKTDNNYFARIGANRIWSQLFARGIVDPVDDFRDSNPGTNEPLLDALAAEFRKANYSTKHLLRIILNSNTYQSISMPSNGQKDDEYYFSHQRPRFLDAEQLLDAVNHVTGISQRFGGLPVSTRATQLPAPDLVKVDFLKVFGQPERSTVCACERSSDSNLAMAIELFNGPVIYERLKDPNNRFRKLLAAGQSPEAVMDDLYLAALARLPNAEERAAATQHLAKNPDIATSFEDLCWALLNSDEFLFQH
jgi:hypothetical protein